jgi:hypothetical protein
MPLSGSLVPVSGRLYRSTVSQLRREQFRVDLPHGLVIERLPVGLAHGHWHLSFVASGVDFRQGDPPRAVGFRDEFRDMVAVQGVGAALDYRGGRASGGDDEQEVSMRYLDNGLTALEVAYLLNGDIVAQETIDLTT